MYKMVQDAKIVSRQEIAKNIIDMWVENDYIAQNAKPGQFLHIKCGDSIDTLLRRPISICDVSENRTRFIFEIKGEGTALLAKKQAGDTVNILGPLGNGFEVTDGRALVLGGGIGTFPMLLLAKKLKNPKLFMGYRNKDLITLQDEFSAAGELFITTDDGSFGHHGFVTDLAKQHLSQCDILYACGPAPMLRIVQKIAKEAGVRAQISMEQRMGCGIGACLTCVCKTVDGYGKVCQHGPVFEAEEVVF